MKLYRAFYPIPCLHPILLPGFLGPLELELSWSFVAENGLFLISTTSADTWYAAFSALLIFPLGFPSYPLMSPLPLSLSLWVHSLALIFVGLQEGKEINPCVQTTIFPSQQKYFETIKWIALFWALGPEFQERCKFFPWEATFLGVPGARGVPEYLVFFFPEARTRPAVFLPDPFIQFSSYLTVEAFSICQGANSGWLLPVVKPYMPMIATQEDRWITVLSPESLVVVKMTL